MIADIISLIMYLTGSNHEIYRMTKLDFIKDICYCIFVLGPFVNSLDV